MQKPETQATIEKIVLAHVQYDISSGEGSFTFAPSHTMLGLPNYSLYTPISTEDLIPLVSPFVHCIPEEHEAFFCFESLLKLLDRHFSTESLNNRVARLVMLFRSVLPDLCVIAIATRFRSCRTHMGSS